MFIEIAFENLPYYVSWISVVAFSICVHEYAHAIAAYRCGDDTAARAGHLTLNPVIQMGGRSLFMLALIGIAWGAVPVDPSRLRRRYGEAIVAIAGPLSNLCLALIAALLYILLSATPAANLVDIACRANGTLFVLNMLPAPMLDGWKVYAAFVPAMNRVSEKQANTASLVMLLLVFVTPFGGLLWRAGEFIAANMVGLWLTVLAPLLGS
jgi:Zn-dependent protease|tara:strand:+ start:2363 stop:2992 length:630 start_codon:yes stop_codon:yes gene_type:complete